MAATAPKFEDGSGGGDLERLLRAIRLSTAATMAGAMVTARGKPTSIAEVLMVTKAIEKALVAVEYRGSRMKTEPNAYDATPEMGMDEIYS